MSDLETVRMTPTALVCPYCGKGPVWAEELANVCLDCGARFDLTRYAGSGKTLFGKRILSEMRKRAGWTGETP